MVEEGPISDSGSGGEAEAVHMDGDGLPPALQEASAQVLKRVKVFYSLFYFSSLIRRFIQALKKLQLSSLEVEAQFHSKVHELKAQFASLFHEMGEKVYFNI
jgi:hypothetical protein